MSLVTKKSSGAAATATATATEKVVPLVAPAGEQRRCAHYCKQVGEAGRTKLNDIIQLGSL